MKHKIDNLDKKILKLISQNARIPFLEVARGCNVSGAAIHQRVQKLLAMGVIKGSEFIIDTYKVGYETCAYMGLTLKSTSMFEEVVNAMKQIPEIVECHYTTGKYALFIKVYARDNRHLLSLIINKITAINGIENTETFLLSLDEIFNRQLSVFDNDNEPQDQEEESVEE